MDFLTKIFDITKLPSKFFAWVALLSGVYIFLPQSFVETMHLGNFPTEYRAYAGIAFISSLSFLLINFLIWLWAVIIGIWRRKNYRENIKRGLQELDEEEIATLREFIIQGRHVIELPVDHPTVAGLINKRIILVASRTGYRDLAGSVFPVQLSNTAKELITFELLSIPPELDEGVKNIILSERPIYTRQIQKAAQLRGGMFR